MNPNDEFIKSVVNELGDDVLVKGDDAWSLRRDWWPLLMLREVLGQGINVPVVLRPRTIEELIIIVKLACKYGVGIVPFGGGSSVVGGSYHNGNVIIDLSMLNKILNFNSDDLLVTVEAGIKVRDLEAWLNERGFTLDFHPQSFQLLTVGGAIAHGATGSHDMSNIEELTHSIDVVLPNGELVSLGVRGAPRASLGPDLKRLFIGSEGTLGFIVRATLKVKPLANVALDRAYVFPDVRSALSFARECSIKLPHPLRLVIHDNESSRLFLGMDNTVALLRIRGYMNELVQLMANITDGIARSYGGEISEASLISKWRYVFSREYERQLGELVRSGYWVETLDTAGTWTVLNKAYWELTARLHGIKGVDLVLTRFTHFYLNGASMYVVVVFRQSEETYWRIWEVTAEVMHKYGGTISHHHGIGLLKRRWLIKELGGGQYELLRRIKGVLDDAGIMNPGKLV
ncbi:FAD-binding oxidoreductase [Vulcanisaeta thermophila]|uniref:FAD-binding oxidoreductase n=1 Tax=Vulcanisaeta thermophila TaxID=867917 RepID=UPI000852BE1A|nr:FAD-binding oxidoreductase [Vulcanisaeta thermophila]